MTLFLRGEVRVCKSLSINDLGCVKRGPCRITDKDYSVEIKGENLFRFRQTDNVLDLGLDVDDREFVISGTSPEGWSEICSAAGIEEA